MIYFAVFPMTFLGAMGAYFFKRASSQTKSLIGLVRCPALYLGGMLYVASALMNIVLLRYADYSVLYPMTSVTYAWTALISYKLLNERITKRMLIGIALICVGVVLLTR